ncbi:hypothetical protein [Corynebacterium kefirresidentii]|uniref:hypothetical protein n=1 Tax=Corynebacterium kefirresidentii TaxID=1979527 RepID=UPI0039B01222
MLNTQHDDYTHLTAEDWGAWLLAHNHCELNNTRTLDDTTFLQVSRMTTMETYSHLEAAGLIEKTETGNTHINNPKETN